MSRETRLAVCSLVCVVTACATYQEPGANAPSAHLTLSSNLGQDPYSRDGQGVGHNAFVAFGDAACEVLFGTMEMFKMGLFEPEKGGSKIVRIEPGKRLYLRTDWQHTRGIGNQTEARRTCYNFVSFVPEAGGRYEVRQTVTQGSLDRPACNAVVRKLDEPGPVKSFEQHALTGKCAAYVRGPGAR
jgi:hypothetical protein